MAKKTTGKIDLKQAETRDERDVRTAKQRREAREAAEGAGPADRAAQEDEDKAQRREDLDASGEDEGDLEEVDNDQLPINHQTLLDQRDVDAGKLPPEASPREGKTSPAPPVSPAPRGGGTSKAARDASDRSELVQATQMGYYDHARRRPGDVFSINPDDFADEWMRKAPKDAVPHTTGANAAIRKENQATRELRLGSSGMQGAPAPRLTGPSAGVDQAPEANPLDAD